MVNRKIFVSVIDDSSRAQLLDCILFQKHLIPSLRTFFEDQKYLEPCSMILKSLLDDTEKRPLWRAFGANYWAPNNTQLQYSEGTCSMVDLQLPPSDQEEMGKRLAYLQLWLFSMRHFPELTDFKPRIQSRKNERIRRTYSAVRLQQLGCLAVKLGFRTRKALDLAMRVAEWSEDIVQEMQQPLTLETSTLKFTSTRRLPRERRNGRPYDQDHDLDQASLFPFVFYQNIEPGKDITSLFVKRNIFQAFLGPFIPPVGEEDSTHDHN
jgi:hypothetical protein